MKKHLQWDEPLHDDLKNKWNVTSQNIQDATALILIPRQYLQLIPSSLANIHVFADASISSRLSSSKQSHIIYYVKEQGSTTQVFDIAQNRIVGCYIGR